MMTAEARRDFLVGRQGGMGGTDMPILLGLVRNRNALDLYNEKSRPIGDVDMERSVDLLRGRELEDMARLHYVAKTGRKVRKKNVATRHPKFPAFQCHLDFEILSDPEREKEWTRGPGVGETKCPRAGVLRSIVDEGVRQTTLIQGLTYCAVARRGWCGFNFFSLEWDGGDGSPVLPVDVEADEGLGQHLLETGQRFWSEHVVPRVPPDPTEWMVVGREIEEAVRESSGEVFEVLDEEIEKLAAEIVHAEKTQKRFKGTVAEKMDRLLAWIEANSPSDRIIIPSVGKFTVTRSEGRRSFNREALELHRPIDRDKFEKFLREDCWIYELDDVAHRQPSLAMIGELLLKSELDIDQFFRQGDPYKFVRAYPKKDETE